MYPTPTTSAVIAMLAGLIAAALIIGQLDGRLNPATRYRAALIFYALPVLPVMAFGLVVASARFPFDAGPANHCRDALCRLAVFREADLAMMLHQGMAELLCFGLMLLIFWSRSYRIGSRLKAMLTRLPHPSRVPLLPGFDSRGLHNYNPKHFYIEPDTGQSYRITRHRLDGSLVLDPKTYDQRRQDYLDAVHGAWTMFQSFIVFCVMGLGVWALWVFMPGPFTAIVVVIASIGIMIPFGVLARSMGNAVYAPVLQARVGPQPNAPSGRAEVESRKIHGPGGFLTGEQLRRAARGGTSSTGRTAPLEPFDD